MDRIGKHSAEHVACGMESTKLNIEINTRIEMKKLNFHTPDHRGKSKCHTMHIGKRSENCPNLKVHWSDMEKFTSDTYLGDIISSDGKNKLNKLGLSCAKLRSS
jgi:hypothetical protein